MHCQSCTYFCSGKFTDFDDLACRCIAGNDGDCTLVQPESCREDFCHRGICLAAFSRGTHPYLQAVTEPAGDFISRRAGYNLQG